MNKILNCLGALVFATTISCSTSQDDTIAVADKSFNKDWLFSKDAVGNAEQVDFDDSDWQKVTLPHDWAIYGPFSNQNNARTGGLPIKGTGWYRKHFTLDKRYQDKKVSVAFDGAMSNAKVFLNGHFVGERPYGYIGFEVDISEFIKFDADNVLTVKLSPEDLAMRWYPGAGIYRNVYLKINDPIHIPQWGTYITTPSVGKQSATVKIETSVFNGLDKSTDGVLESTILDPEGRQIGTVSSEFSIDPSTENTLVQELDVSKPVLWDIEQPKLHKVISKVLINERVVDEYSTDFGIRSIEFDRNKGFLLNGRAVELNGVCMHHDLGPLGSAVNYRATERQMQIMQQMGVNALRTSHNPPSPEMLQVCDRLGIVVIVEAFDEWKIGKVVNGYNKYFDQWHERDLRDMIRRDRNHPSVIMWSIGNEILEQGKEDGWILTKHLNDICHDEDNTRPTTVGFNYYPAPFNHKLAEQVDIVGMNYWPEDYREILDQNPAMIVYGSETSSQTSSRGIYHLPIAAEEKHETNHVSSYDAIVGPPWAYPPDVEFDAQEKEPRSLGEFIWTGFDYLGEPTPYGGRDNSTNGYWNADWPSRSSYFAPVDLCGFPKDRFYLYQSQWTEEPMVHVLPHWNWPDRVGKKIPVVAYTNAEEVELFINGKSFGKRIKGKDLTQIPAEYHGFEKGTYSTKYRLSWEVPYEPGSIKVVAYNKGVKVASKEVKTAKASAKISMIADRSEIIADGKDLSFITIDILDEDGVFNPLAEDTIKFKVEGAGAIEAVCNGDQTSLTSFKTDEIKAFSGKCLLIVRADEEGGDIKVTATSDGLEPQELILKSRK